MIETLISIIISYVGTNIDDIFINTLFFAQADTKRKIQFVVLGKYLGIGFLVLLSCLGAYFLHIIPQQYIGLLGIVPISLGIKEWISYKKHKSKVSSDENRKAASSHGLILNVALVTVSNGADNIGVYVPLFANYTALQMAIMIIVFSIMLALWCLLGKKLSDLPGLRGFLLKYKHIIVPAVFIILGIYIFMKSIL